MIHHSGRYVNRKRILSTAINKLGLKTTLLLSAYKTFYEVICDSFIRKIAPVFYVSQFGKFLLNIFQ